MRVAFLTLAFCAVSQATVLRWFGLNSNNEQTHQETTVSFPAQTIQPPHPVQPVVLNLPTLAQRPMNIHLLPLPPLNLAIRPPVSFFDYVHPRRPLIPGHVFLGPPVGPLANYGQAVIHKLPNVENQVVNSLPLSGQHEIQVAPQVITHPAYVSSQGSPQEHPVYISQHSFTSEHPAYVSEKPSSSGHQYYASEHTLPSAHPTHFDQQGSSAGPIPLSPASLVRPVNQSYQPYQIPSDTGYTESQQVNSQSLGNLNNFNYLPPNQSSQQQEPFQFPTDQQLPYSNSNNFNPSIEVDHENFPPQSDALQVSSAYTNGNTYSNDVSPTSITNSEGSQHIDQHSYALSDGTHVSEQTSLVPSADGTNEQLVKNGEYEYRDQNGTLVKVKWIADENGFRVIS